MEDPQELQWTPNRPPPMVMGPNLDNQAEVMAEIKRIESSLRSSKLRSGSLLSLPWHNDWFVTADYPEKTMANLSRWLIRVHEIDLTAAECRQQIMPYDTFAPFGVKVLEWLEQFAPSAAYELARAARFILPIDPLLMTPEQIELALAKQITPIMEAFPYKAGVRDVFPILRNKGLLKDSTRVSVRSRGPKAEDLSLLQVLALNSTGLVVENDDDDGEVMMFLPRRNPRRQATEQKWCDWFQAFCDTHDIDRDEAFARIMECAMTKHPMDEQA